MSNNIRSTNLRFNLDRDIQRQAWQYLQTMDKSIFKSYNYAIALSVVDYFERYYRKKDDPYFETRQREEKFVEQIVGAVENAMEKKLPLFFAGLFSGMGRIQQADSLLQMPLSDIPAQQAGGHDSAKLKFDAEDVDWDFLGE